MNEEQTPVPPETRELAEQGGPVTGSDEVSNRPRLWNPNAAGLWSLLFTPGFGALLHAANWRTLGEPERAKANKGWFWGVVVFLVLAVATIPLGDVPGLDRAFQITGIVMLILWFYRQCKPQMEYVKQRYGDNYERRGWGMPLGLATMLLVVFLVLVVVIAEATHKVEPEAVVELIEPKILTDWRADPAIETASIERFTLAPSGEKDDRFAGEIEATINGEPQRMTITVIIIGDQITWQLKAIKD